MKTSAMIDIETLATNYDAVVLSVGAWKFNPYDRREPWDGQLWKLDIDQQTQAGREISDSTIEWWAKQDPEIQARAFSDEGRIKLNAFFKALNKYLVGVDKIWCQGPQFDMVILEHMFDQFKQNKNWAYWQVMDSRTLFQLMPQDPRKAIQEDAHDASADAYYQAICVQQCFEHFRVHQD
jgi:hypothetical protein